MKTTIGRVELDAVELRFKEVALFLTCITLRTAKHFDVACPLSAAEQLPG